MLSAELHGEAYNKAAHRRGLLPLLNERSEGAIERKHGNISAVLIELGFPYISGYKPFSNYQQLLFNVVAFRLGASPDLERLVAADADAVPDAPSYDDILASLVDPPKPSGKMGRVRETPDSSYGTARRPPRINYLKRESENVALGAAGELFVLDFERARLVAAGEESLAADIEHVSKTRGDGDGFDILSYEASGAERLIEVKTTKYAAQTPFFVSVNEVKVSEREADRYHLYRVFEFRKSPRLFSVPGALPTIFDLSPTQFLAKIA